MLACMNIRRYTQLHGRYWKPNNQLLGSSLTRIFTPEVDV